MGKHHKHRSDSSLIVQGNPGALSSSGHVVLTSFLAIAVTLVASFSFYLYRTVSSRDRAFTDALKVVRASTEVVASIAERGIPSLRSRMDELESKERALEQQQKRSATLMERLMAATTSTLSTVAGSATVAETVGVSPSDTDMLAARRAARAAVK